MAEQLREKLEQETLPGFIAAQRWYSGAVQRAMLVDQVEWTLAENHLLGIFRLDGEGENALYFLPLSLHWESEEELVHTAVIARVRQQAHTGLINDAWADAGFCRGLAQAIGDELQLPCERGSIRFMPTAAFARCCDAEIATLPVSWPPTAKGSYSAAAIGRCVYLKGYRRLSPGLHPAIELGQYLTRNGFPYAPLTLGTVEYQDDDDGRQATLCWVQGYVENQGDFWSYTLDYLAHFLEECCDAEHPVMAAEIAHQAYLVLLRTLAQRTAQLHAALADGAGDPAFMPEPVSDADMAGWAREVREDVATVLESLAAGLADMPGNIRDEVEGLLAQRQPIEARIERAGAAHVMAAKIRCHGDYHLRQVLINQNDFVITDREDEPVRPYAERRRKQSPMRDVAHLLQSLHIAGTTALLQASTERPESYEELEPLVRNWAVEAMRVFLDGYQEHARDGQLYASWDDMRGLLELFQIEQAFRQLRYDREFRPEWVGLSARSIRQLMP
jgi:maltose alpha-D-glucosyltransferase/alpha-amylase